MIKGHTTIQLRNAKTGEIEREIKHDNIVTNAVQNVFALPYSVRSLYKTSDTRTTGAGNGWEAMIRGQNMPYYAKAYGGISLFRDAITLDADNVMIDGTNKLVGYAGDVGTEVEADMLCGERNATESKEIENGYHFVWDFDTEKANGTFRSVSLGLTDAAKYAKTAMTNYRGFNSVFRCKYNSSDEDYPALSSVADWFTVDFSKTIEGTTLINRVVRLEKLDSGDTAVYIVSIISDNQRYPNIQLTKLTVQAFNKMSIFGKAKLTVKNSEVLLAERLPNSTVEKITTDTSLFQNLQNIQIDSDNNIHILYYADMTTDSSKNLVMSQFVHTIYRLDGTRISSEVISFPAQKTFDRRLYFANVPCGYCNGLYYDIVPNSAGVFCLRRFNKDGVADETELTGTAATTRLSTFSVSSANIAHVTYTAAVNRYAEYYHNSYMLPSGEGEKPQLLQSSRVSSSLTNNDVYLSHTSYNFADIRQPFQVMSKYSNDTTASVCILASPHYLGTINNLDTAITKTDAQTMKIIYDLIEEEDV